LSDMFTAEEDPPDPPAGQNLTPLTCPECEGTLWLHAAYGAERFRCRAGHSFSADRLMVGKQNALESALWAAIVALQERADVSRRIVQRLKESGRPAQIDRYRSEVHESEQRARVLQDLIGDLVQGVSSRHAEEINGGTAS
jgi:two-component system, chemotaxis family, protein-glutamate methylesterase/glutaminase